MRLQRHSSKTIVLWLVFSFLPLECAQAASSESPVFSLTTPADLVIRDPSRFEAPLEFAALKEISRGQGDVFIIHIQDPHSNVSGQRNLAGALEEILSRYDVSLVLSEGGGSDCSLTPLKKIAPAAVWKKVANKFLLDGRISGEEYLNLTSDRSMKIMGIEDMDLYLKNVENYGLIVDKREEALSYLARVRAAVSKLKNRLYPKELLFYEKKKRNTGALFSQADLDGILDLAARSHADLEELPALKKIRTLKEKEAGIDFDLAGLEQASLLEELVRKGAAGDFKTRSLAADRRNDEKVSRYAHFLVVLEAARKAKIRLYSYPHWIRYGKHLRDFSEIDLDMVVEELAILEDRVYAGLLEMPDARLVRAIDRYLGLLEAACHVRMTKAEFKLFRANEPDFTTPVYLAFVNAALVERGYAEDLVPYKTVLDETGKALEAFYESVDKRDRAFLENTEIALSREKRKIAVLIAGGYHTAHLKELFNAKGYSYVVLAPHVLRETNYSKYEERLLDAFHGGVTSVKDRIVTPAVEKDGVRPPLAAAFVTSGDPAATLALLRRSLRAVRENNFDAVDKKVRVFFSLAYAGAFETTRHHGRAKARVGRVVLEGRVKKPMGARLEGGTHESELSSPRVELAAAIALGIGQPADADGIREFLTQFDDALIRGAHLRRYNLESDFYAARFRREWIADPERAFRDLAEGFLQTDTLDGKGRLYLDVPDGIETPVFDPPVFNRPIYKNNHNHGKNVQVEWMWHPQVRFWFPVSIRVEDKRPSPVTMKAVLHSSEPVVRYLGMMLPRRRLEAFGPCRLLGRVPPRHTLTIGHEKLASGRGLGIYNLLNSTGEPYLVTIGTHAIVTSIWLPRRGSVPLQIAALKDAGGNVVRLLESHRFFFQEALLELNREHGTFWLQGLKVRKADDKGSAELILGKRRSQAEEESDEEGATTTYVHSFTFSSEYAERAAEVRFAASGVPDLLLIKGAQPSQDETFPLKRVQIRDKNGRILDVVNSFLIYVPPDAVAEALEKAGGMTRDAEARVVVGPLAPFGSPEHQHRMVFAASDEINVPAAVTQALGPQPFIAEVVYGAKPESAKLFEPLFVRFLREETPGDAMAAPRYTLLKTYGLRRMAGDTYALAEESADVFVPPQETAGQTGTRLASTALEFSAAQVAAWRDPRVWNELEEAGASAARAIEAAVIGALNESAKVSVRSLSLKNYLDVSFAQVLAQVLVPAFKNALEFSGKDGVRINIEVLTEGTADDSEIVIRFGSSGASLTPVAIQRSGDSKTAIGGRIFAMRLTLRDDVDDDADVELWDRKALLGPSTSEEGAVHVMRFKAKALLTHFNVSGARVTPPAGETPKEWAARREKLKQVAQGVGARFAKTRFLDYYGANLPSERMAGFGQKGEGSLVRRLTDLAARKRAAELRHLNPLPLAAEGRYGVVNFSKSGQEEVVIRSARAENAFEGRGLLIRRSALARATVRLMNAGPPSSVRASGREEDAVARVSRDYQGLDGISEALLLKAATNLTERKYVVLSLGVEGQDVAEMIRQVRELQMELQVIADSKLIVFFELVDGRGDRVEAVNGFRSDVFRAPAGTALERIYAGVLGDELVRKANSTGAGFLAMEETHGTGNTHNVLPYKPGMRTAILAAVSDVRDEGVRRMLKMLMQTDIGAEEVGLVKRVPDGAAAETYRRKRLIVQALVKQLSRKVYEAYVTPRNTGTSA